MPAKQFEVLFSHVPENATDGRFTTKIRRVEKIIDPIFGEQTQQVTFYIKGTQEVKGDKKKCIMLDLDIFDVNEYPMINPDSGEQFTSKWLKRKIAA